MKNILLSVACCMMVLSCSEIGNNEYDGEYNDRCYQGLYGNVKSVKSITYLDENKLERLFKRSDTYCRFDRNGNLTINVLMVRPNIKERFIWDGNILKEYKYYFRGKEKEKGIYKNDGRYITEMESYDTDGKLLSKTVYSFDRNKRMDKSYDDKGSLVMEHLIEWNEDGFPVFEEYKTIEEDGTTAYNTTVSTYENGKIKTKMYSRNEQDKKSNVETIYQHDNNGILIRAQQTANGSVSKITFECDNKGNWIKKITFNEDGSVWSIEKRNIKYH